MPDRLQQPDRDPQLARNKIVQIATADEVVDVPQLLDPTLDPIHEASDTGWPAQVAPAS